MRPRATTFATGALLVAALVSSACSKPLIPAGERVWQPRPAWRYRVGENLAKPVTRTYPVPKSRARATELARLLEVAGTVVPLEVYDEVQVHAEADGLRVTASPAGHRRMTRMLRAVRDASDLDLTLSISLLRVPLLTANSLGPLQQAYGGELSRLARVPLLAAARRRLERLAARDGGPVTRLGGGVIHAPVGSWKRWRSIRARVYIADVGFVQSTSTPGILLPSTTLGATTTGLSLTAGALPLSREEGVLLAFLAVDRLRQPDTALTHISAGGNTAVELTLPACTVRTAQEAVRLGPGESLALVIPIRDSDFVKLAILTPSFRKVPPVR